MAAEDTTRATKPEPSAKAAHFIWEISLVAYNHVFQGQNTCLNFKEMRVKFINMDNFPPTAEFSCIGSHMNRTFLQCLKLGILVKAFKI